MGNDSPPNFSPNLEFNLQIKMPKGKLRSRMGLLNTLSSIESDWTMGSSDCITLTYDSKLSGSTPSLTKVNSCQDAVGLCKAKLGKWS